MSDDRLVGAATGPQASDVFPVTATASTERQSCTLKDGHTFGLFDPYGDISPGVGSTGGLFHDDTRHLSTLQLLIEGRRPLLLSSNVLDDNALLSVDLTNPDMEDVEGVSLARDTIHILRLKFIRHGQCFERLRVQNYDSRPRRLRLDYVHGCDFADLFEVRGHKRPRRGTVTTSLRGRSVVEFRYTGLDGLIYRTTLQFDPEPATLAPERTSFDLLLPPGEQRHVSLTCRCTRDAERVIPSAQTFLSALREARRDLRSRKSRAAKIHSSNEIFNEVVTRALSDLYMLVTDTEAGPYPYAGVPWYCTVFGRDGIITAIQTLWIDPELARGVLRFLAAHQAHETDPRADAEPGKIIHEMRFGEMARIGEVPFRRYYGSVDSTPLFLLLAGLYHERTGDLDTIREIWPNILAALDWIDLYGDADADGFVEYERKVEAGLLNQGWKDLHDSIFHADGSSARLPIALCEVQGYVYAAKLHAARLAREMGELARATELELDAATLRRKIENAYWLDEIGFYALALDGDKRPCRVRSSNAGHLLFCGVPAESRAERVADQLLHRDFFSGWGVRTLAVAEARYNPMSYHNGSVWPHDNALIALGLSRYGRRNQVLQILRGIFDSASYAEMRRLPELYCGFRRRPGKGPTLYPVACAPQAWACVAPLALLQAALGLEFDAKARAIRFRQPLLPQFLDELVIRNLTLGPASVDVLLRRHDHAVSINVLRRRGDVAVEVKLS